MAGIETGQQAIEFLLGRVDYERISAALSASDFKLDRMRHLLEKVGNPQDRIPAVHVAGTKGKGSTCAMMAGALSVAGYRTGLFTSPHVERFEERIQINGELIDEVALVTHTRRLAEVTEEIDREPGAMQPTFFELTTALAWLWFESRGVQIAVMEVGLGGRLDSTNICRPAVCVLTTISRDHMHILGSRLADIAAEKAGIIKPGVPVISGVTGAEAAEVIEQAAARRAAPLDLIGREFHVEDGYPGEVSRCGGRTGAPIRVRTRDATVDVQPARPGEHQVHNTTLAVAALLKLRQSGWNISDQAIQAGVRDLKWPVRIEVVRENPLVVIDAAHNWASAQALLKTLEAMAVSGRRVLIFATSRDKDVSGLLRLLVPRFDAVVLTRFVKNPRACPVDQLRELTAALSVRPVHCAEEPEAAWRLAQKLAGENGLICAAGSFFLAAEVKTLVLEELSPSAVETPSESASAGCLAPPVTVP